MLALLRDPPEEIVLQLDAHRIAFSAAAAIVAQLRLPAASSNPESYQ